MRLLYVSDSLIPSTKANSVQVMKMCQAFALSGVDVTLICRKGDTVEDIYRHYGVKHVFSIVALKVPEIRIISRVAYLFQAVREVLRSKADLIYGREIVLLAILGVGRLMGKVPLVIELHVPPKNMLQKLMLKFLFRSPSFQHAVVITHSLELEYGRLFEDELKGKIYVAHDGADLPQPDSVISYKRNGRPAIGYVGSLYPGKGLELIVDLAKLCPDYDFHVVGGSEREVALWSQQAESDNVIFHGFHSQSEVLPVMRGFDVLLAPYQNQVKGASGMSDLARWMSPLKIFEYMAAERPMLASDLPVLREVLFHRVNCMLADPSRLGDWISALDELVIDLELSRTLAGKGFTDLVEKYDWNVRAKNLLAAVVPSELGIRDHLPTLE